MSTDNSPFLDLSTPRLCFLAEPTPAACEAPLPGSIATAASVAGACYICIRPSSRSFSRWVMGVYFQCSEDATKFSLSIAKEYGFPFCVVRCLGLWHVVSIPVSIFEFESNRDSLPNFVLPL